MKTLLACSIPPLLLPPQVPLYNRYGDVEGSSVGDYSPLSLDMLTKPNQEKHSPNSKTTSLNEMSIGCRGFLPTGN